jgi:hypothetical protein
MDGKTAMEARKTTEETFRASVAKKEKPINHCRGAPKF